MSASLFGNYQKYYRVTQELPIDCLRKLKEGEMVIKQGSAANTYVVIFNDMEGLPYIKTVEAAGNIFRSGTHSYPTFERFLKTYRAYVWPSQVKAITPVPILPPPPRSVLYNKPLFSLDARVKNTPVRSRGRGAPLNLA